MSQIWSSIGLIGVSLILSRGKIFEGLRTYLLGFNYWYNPLKTLGMVLECSACSGFWAGFIYAVVRGDGVVDAVVFGGAISLASLIVSCAAGWFERVTAEDEGGDEETAEPNQSKENVIQNIMQMRRLLDQSQRQIEQEEEEREENGEG